MNKETLKEKKERLQLEGEGIKIIDKNLYDNSKTKKLVFLVLGLFTYLFIGYVVGFVHGVIRVLN